VPAGNALKPLPAVTVSPDSDQVALRLTQQIEASGSISVAEYMRVANTAYYGRADPLGAEGDFITAPEISQMFGEMVGIWLSDIWLRCSGPANCHYVELGPGRGTLAADALRTMKRFGWEPPVHFVENSPVLRAKQLQAVPASTFHDNLDSLPTNAPLFIVANEFFDALPVRQMVSTQAGWRERVVVRDDASGFAAVPGACATDDLIPEQFRTAAMGSIYEICPDASSIMQQLSARLARQGGVMLTIDYGYTQPALGDTLQAVQNHTYADPFTDPGQRDLTAHVDFFALSNCAKNCGLMVAGPSDQGTWLSSLGIDQRTQHLAATNPGRAADITAARNRLVAPDAMGTLFKVLAAYTQGWPHPAGFGA
jgi:NADH dehydrogenase [ubiquinone] 1 alpha subcomplex assembly factor 7